MGQFFDEIPQNLIEWVRRQEMFWVATAPLSQDGHVNVSPKGLKGSFNIVSQTKVWYEDVTGSGSETIAHLRENGRITILFSAFEGPPRIVRLFGIGTVHELGTPEYNQYIPAENRLAGSRSVIVIDVHKVGTSCGYSVPFYQFQSHRRLLNQKSAKLEARDKEWESEHPSESTEIPANGLRAYWKAHSSSIDGLPSLMTCFEAKNSVLGTHKPVSSEPDAIHTSNKGAFVDRTTAAALIVGVILGATLSNPGAKLIRHALNHSL